MADKTQVIQMPPMIATSENRPILLVTNCFKCGSAKLKLVFKVQGSKMQSFLHCEDCQMRERIALNQFQHEQKNLFRSG